MLSVLDVGFLVVAGVLAGLVGTAGAITSLISYPALLIVGIAPLTAGIANVVAATGSWPGSALTSGAELRGRGGWLSRRAPLAGLGGLIGGALLVATPSGAFERIVPVLVAGGSLVLLAAPWLTAHRSAATARREPRGTAPAILLLSVYSGYFGAGSGVMLLALCLVCVDPDLPVANALKNMLVGGATIAGALAVMLFGHVRWDAVVPLGIGVFLGATLGPPVARRIPERVLRPLVAAFGIGLAVQLWLSHGA